MDTTVVSDAKENSACGEYSSSPKHDSFDETSQFNEDYENEDIYYDIDSNHGDTIIINGTEYMEIDDDCDNGEVGDSKLKVDNESDCIHWWEHEIEDGPQVGFISQRDSIEKSKDLKTQNVSTIPPCQTIPPSSTEADDGKNTYQGKDTESVIKSSHDASVRPNNDASSCCQTEVHLTHSNETSSPKSESKIDKLDAYSTRNDITPNQAQNQSTVSSGNQTGIEIEAQLTVQRCQRVQYPKPILKNTNCTLAEMSFQFCPPKGESDDCNMSSVLCPNRSVDQIGGSHDSSSSVLSNQIQTPVTETIFPVWFSHHSSEEPSVKNQSSQINSNVINDNSMNENKCVPSSQENFNFANAQGNNEPEIEIEVPKDTFLDQEDEKQLGSSNQEEDREEGELSPEHGDPDDVEEVKQNDHCKPLETVHKCSEEETINTNKTVLVKQHRRKNGNEERRNISVREKGNEYSLRKKRSYSSVRKHSPNSKRSRYDNREKGSERIVSQEAKKSRCDDGSRNYSSERRRSIEFSRPKRNSPSKTKRNSKGSLSSSSRRPKDDRSRESRRMSRRDQYLQHLANKALTDKTSSPPKKINEKEEEERVKTLVKRQMTIITRHIDKASATAFNENVRNVSGTHRYGIEPRSRRRSPDECQERVKERNRRTILGHLQTPHSTNKGELSSLSTTVRATNIRNLVKAMKPISLDYNSSGGHSSKGRGLHFETKKTTGSWRDVLVMTESSEKVKNSNAQKKKLNKSNVLSGDPIVKESDTTKLTNIKNTKQVPTKRDQEQRKNKINKNDGSKYVVPISERSNPLALLKSNVEEHETVSSCDLNVTNEIDAKYSSKKISDYSSPGCCEATSKRKYLKVSENPRTHKKTKRDSELLLAKKTGHSTSFDMHKSNIGSNSSVKSLLNSVGKITAKKTFTYQIIANKPLKKSGCPARKVMIVSSVKLGSIAIPQNLFQLLCSNKVKDGILLKGPKVMKSRPKIQKSSTRTNRDRYESDLETGESLEKLETFLEELREAKTSNLISTTVSQVRPILQERVAREDKFLDRHRAKRRAKLMACVSVTPETAAKEARCLEDMKREKRTRANLPLILNAACGTVKERLSRSNSPVSHHSGAVLRSNGTGRQDARSGEPPAALNANDETVQSSSPICEALMKDQVGQTMS